MLHKWANCEWSVPPDDTKCYGYDKVQVIVLMDIRRELQKLNALLACPNFTSIPRVLKGIRRNTTKDIKKSRKRR